jgi:hypothetical protein
MIPIYTMSKTTSNQFTKSVFGMSDEELQEKLRPTAEKIKRGAWGNNSYITYYDEELCPSYNFMVHEYHDRKELVRVKENGETQVIKIL